MILQNHSNKRFEAEEKNILLSMLKTVVLFNILGGNILFVIKKCNLEHNTLLDILRVFTVANLFDLQLQTVLFTVKLL